MNLRRGADRAWACAPHLKVQTKAFAAWRVATFVGVGNGARAALRMLRNALHQEHKPCESRSFSIPGR